MAGESAYSTESVKLLRTFGFAVIPADYDLLEAGYVVRGVVWRNNSGGFYAGGHYYRYGCEGTPDWHGYLCPEGTYFGIEDKDPSRKKAKMEPKQPIFLAHAAANGCAVRLMKSLDELAAWLAELARTRKAIKQAKA
jgi:hypothetical protein